MNDASEDPAVQRKQRIARQRNTVMIMAMILVLGGLIILFFLKRLPLPMRILAGLTDVFGGLVLLVLVRQKFEK